MKIDIQDDVFFVIDDDNVSEHNKQHSIKCIMKGCSNKRTEGSFVGDLCTPCHNAITTGDLSGNGLGVVGNLFREKEELRKTKRTHSLEFDIRNADTVELTSNMYDLCEYYRNSWVNIFINGLSPTREHLWEIISEHSDIELKIISIDLDGDNYQAPPRIIANIKEETECFIKIASGEEDYQIYHEIKKKHIYGV